MNDNKVDKRQLEPNQSISKQYAVSYALLTYKKIYKNADLVSFGVEMVNQMRTIKPKLAVQKADGLLQSCINSDENENNFTRKRADAYEQKRRKNRL